MKLAIIFLAVLGTAYSHQFFAETNFKCQLCKETLNLVRQQDFKQLYSVLTKFPKAQEMMGLSDETIIKLATAEGFKTTVSNSKIADMCESMKMCEEHAEDFEIDHLKHINEVNNDKDSTWTAGVNLKTLLSGDRLMASEIKASLGAIVDPEWTLTSEPRDDHYTIPVEDLPDTFDAREQWPNCKELATVRDQSDCGSCWAHGTTEAFNDRECIAGKAQMLFSTADTTGCCDFIQCFSMGCNGGQILPPWNWFESKGVVTGGNMESNDGCYPYTMPECEHHVSGAKKSCTDVQKVSPTCSKKCTSSYGHDYAGDKHKAVAQGYSVSPGNIKRELVEHGPVTGAFIVYEDFINYKSGVYQHKTGQQLGGHAIKIIGYGKEDGLDYLLVMNSWNEDWGDKGLFKIVPDEMMQLTAGDVNAKHSTGFRPDLRVIDE